MRLTANALALSLAVSVVIALPEGEEEKTRMPSD